MTAPAKSDQEVSGLPSETRLHIEGERLLLEFVRDRDIECPRCEHNLRNITEARCPECGDRLRLTVGQAQLRLGAFLIAVVPCAFSGIAALLLAAPIIIVPFTEGGFAPWRILALDAFGWLSGFTGIWLFAHRRRFLRIAYARQVQFAALIWFIHLAAFVVFLWLSRW